jgi:hypothetical protein
MYVSGQLHALADLLLGGWVIPRADLDVMENKF